MGRPTQQSLSSFLGSPLNAIDDNGSVSDDKCSVDDGSVSRDFCPNGCSLVFVTLWVFPQNREAEAIFWFKMKEKKILLTGLRRMKTQAILAHHGTKCLLTAKFTLCL